jgi:hypothetical protein
MKIIANEQNLPTNEAPETETKVVAPAPEEAVEAVEAVETLEEGVTDVTFVQQGTRYLVPWIMNEKGIKVPKFGEDGHNPRRNQNQFVREIMYLNPDAPMSDVVEEIANHIPAKNGKPDIGYARVYYTWGNREAGCPGNIVKAIRAREEPPKTPKPVKAPVGRLNEPKTKAETAAEAEVRSKNMDRLRAAQAKIQARKAGAKAETEVKAESAA